MTTTILNVVVLLFLCRVSIKILSFSQVPVSVLVLGRTNERAFPDFSISTAPPVGCSRSFAAE